MRILLIASVFPPHNAAGSLRTYGLARTWAEAGCDVTVLTTAKHADQTGFDAPVRGFELVEIAHQIPRFLSMLRAYSRQSHNGNGTNESPGHSHGGSFLRRSLHRLHQHTGVFGCSRMPDLTDSWVKPATQWALAQPPWDVIASSSGPYTNHLIAKTLRHLSASHQTIWAADFRDLWTENPGAHGLFPFTIVERKLENECLQSADLITTVSEPMARQLGRRTSKPVHVIRNGSAAGLFESLPPERCFPNDDLHRLVYTGSIYPGTRDPEVTLAGLAHLRQIAPDAAARLRLIIAGDNQDLWRHRAAAHNVSDLIEHRGLVNRRQALHMQRDADALLLLDWHDPHAGVMTSKIYEYLAAGPAVFATGGTAESPVGALLRTTERGQHFGADPIQIARDLQTWLENPSSTNLRADPESLREFTIEYQAAKFLDILRQTHAEAACAESSACSAGN